MTPTRRRGRSIETSISGRKGTSSTPWWSPISGTARWARRTSTSTIRVRRPLPGLMAAFCRCRTLISPSIRRIARLPTAIRPPSLPSTPGICAYAPTDCFPTAQAMIRSAAMSTTTTTPGWRWSSAMPTTGSAIRPIWKRRRAAAPSALRVLL